MLWSNLDTLVDNSGCCTLDIFISLLRGVVARLLIMKSFRFIRVVLARDALSGSSEMLYRVRVGEEITQWKIYVCYFKSISPLPIVPTGRKKCLWNLCPTCRQRAPLKVETVWGKRKLVQCCCVEKLKSAMVRSLLCTQVVSVDNFTSYFRKDYYCFTLELADNS